MKITYQYTKNFKNIDSPTGRLYEVPLGKYPSVTTVLGQTSNMSYIQAWKDRVGEQEAAAILEKAGIRGSTIHKYLEDFSDMYPDFSQGSIEQFYKDSDISNEPLMYQRLVKMLIKHLKDCNYKNIASEFVVWDDDLKLAGRCDAIGIYNNRLTIIDFKTSIKKKSLFSEALKNYKLQATAYCKAHNMLFEHKVNNFCILIVTEDFNLQKIEGNSLNFIPELRYRVRRFYEQQERKKD